MKNSRFSRRTVLSAFIAISGFSALAAVNLTSFSPRTPIKSAEINANFSSLRTAVEALEAPGGISSARLAPGGADGKVLKLAGGKPVWGDDLVGSGGGTAYTAGTGLSMAGSTFTLADGGVTVNKLAATGAVDGKVLKLSSGNLTWSDDLTGSGGGGGTTYSADGSSLQLSGTTFSVKNGGVTAAKLSFPLSTNGGFGPTGLSVTNTTSSGLAIALRGQGGTGAGLAHIGQIGVLGESAEGIGVLGAGTNSIGVLGRSSQRGVVGTQGSLALSCSGIYAVGGCAESSGIGVLGRSITGTGVEGISTSGSGVLGRSASGSAVTGQSTSGYSAEFSGGKFGAGVCYYAGGAGWSCSSDRKLKENFQALNPTKVLEAVVKMPVTRWTMKGDVRKTQHIGPVAQDFYSAFGLGSDDKTINSADAQGISLVAIQGLNAKNQALEQKNQALEQKYKALEDRLDALEQTLNP